MAVCSTGKRAGGSHSAKRTRPRYPSLTSYALSGFFTKLEDTDGGGGEERRKGVTRRLRLVATHTDTMPPKLARRGPVEYARGRVARRSQPES